MQNTTSYPLTEVEQSYFQQARQEEDRLRGEYYKALGHVKEVETQIASLLATRDQQAVLIVTRVSGPPKGLITIAADAKSLSLQAAPAAAPGAPPPPMANGLEKTASQGKKEN